MNYIYLLVHVLLNNSLTVNKKKNLFLLEVTSQEPARGKKLSGPKPPQNRTAPKVCLRPTGNLKYYRTWHSNTVVSRQLFFLSPRQIWVNKFRIRIKKRGPDAPGTYLVGNILLEDDPVAGGVVPLAADGTGEDDAHRAAKAAVTAYNLEAGEERTVFSIITVDHKPRNKYKNTEP